MRPKLAGALATAVILVVTLPFCSNMDTFRRIGLCQPSATLAASAFGVPCVTDADDGGYLIPLAVMPIHVVLECSAIRYCCIAAALLAGLCVERRRWGLLAFVVPVAYVLTLVANAARIVCGWHVQRIVTPFLSAHDLPAVHMLVGAACFIIFLILAYNLAERSLRHGTTETVAG